MITFFTKYFARTLCLASLLACTIGTGNAQIWPPEGLNMPGAWDSWSNYPGNVALRTETSTPTPGRLSLISSGIRRYQTNFSVAASGADLTGGSYEFKFAAGPPSSPWSNAWGNGNFSMNTLTNVDIGGGTSNNNITLTNGKHYTMNWRDNGYANTQAIFMETSAAPITVSSTSQNPTAGNVTPSDAVDVSITLSTAKSTEEIVYVRYTTDNYTTSSMLTATGSGTSYSATIPAQADGITVQYYAMTSTATGITADHDMYTLSKSSTQSYTSAALPPVNISFRVDMQNETVAGSGVFVAGSFNGWNATANPLTLISGTTYGATIALAQGSNIEFKFINGSSWESGLSGGCVNGSGNRIYTVGNGDATISSTCYGKCNACVAKVATTFRVNMNGLTVSANGVHVAGDFGSTYPQWDPAAIALTDQGGGIYATTLMLVPGQVVPFKFINGNAWGADEGVPGACNVSGNRSFTVPSGAASTPLVCFGTCGTCITVTFQVDMTGETVSGNGVHVAGAFQGWNPGTTQLSNIGGNIYARTVLVDPNQVSDYKFINGNAWGGDESVANVCSPGSNGNRNFAMGTSSKTLPVVCFRQCLGCTDETRWRGVNSNFADGNNWTSGAAPVSGCRPVVINSSANNPQISGGSFSLGNVTFNGGAGINIGTGANLSICGNITGGSAWLSGDGNITLNGTSAQTISGNLVTSGSGTLTINNPAGVGLGTGTNMTVRNSLKLQGGNFNVASGNLVIGADASNQGRLLKVESGASLTGDITYQKYLSGLNSTASGAWYYVSPTVSGFTMGEYDQGGNNLHPATFLPGNPDPASLYYYSNNGGTFDEFGWAKAASSTQSVSSGQGLRVWARKVTSNSRFAYSGSPVSGTVNFPISYCSSGCSYPSSGNTFNGWNLVGNSYPCTIDWNAASGWTKTGIDGNAIAIWNAATESYATYDGSVGLNGGSRYIAGGQAFFVNATSGSSALSMTEDVKVNINSSGLRVATEEISGLKITAISGNRRDEAFLNITPGFENSAAPKLDNPGITLSFGQNNRYSIAAPEVVSEAGIIPLNLRRAGDQFQFELEKTGSQWMMSQVYLKDDVSGQLFPVAEGINTFSFSGSTNDQNRFSLIVSDAATSVAGKLSSGFSIYPNPSAGKVMLRNASGLNGAYEISDLSGKTLISGRLNGVNQELNVQSLPAGQFLIRFEGSPEVIRFSKL